MKSDRTNRTDALRNSAQRLMRDFRETARKLGRPGMLLPAEAAAQAAHIIEQSAHLWRATADRQAFLAVMRGEVVAGPAPQGDLEGPAVQFYAELARLIEAAGDAHRG